MPRRPDVSCAGGCGTLIWRGSGSLGLGQSMCQPCRARVRAGLGPVCGPRRLRTFAPGPCDGCGVDTTRGPTPVGRYCSSCGLELRRASYRRKSHVRRCRSQVTDLTSADERALRTHTHVCPLCDRYLVDQPNLPNSKELDHVLPLVAGGAHTLSNVRIVCRKCNRQRPWDGSDVPWLSNAQ